MNEILEYQQNACRRPTKDNPFMNPPVTDFGKEKRELSKATVLKFNEVIKQNISEEKLKHFAEVADTINELITEKKIF